MASSKPTALVDYMVRWAQLDNEALGPWPTARLQSRAVAPVARGAKRRWRRFLLTPNYGLGLYDVHRVSFLTR